MLWGGALRVGDLHEFCIVRRIRYRWNPDPFSHRRGRGPGAIAFRMVPRWRHRIKLGVRDGPGGLESGPNLLSNGTHVSMRTPFQKCPDTAGVYDIAAAAGAGFEVSAGRFFDRTRLEFSLRQRENGLDQMFRSITEYDGTPLRERSGSSVVSKTQASIDHLTMRTLTVNAYYDFPETFGRDFPIPGRWTWSRVRHGVRVALLRGVRGYVWQCSGVRSTAVVLQQPPGTLTCPTQSWLATCTLVSTTASPTRHLGWTEAELLDDGQH